MYALVAPGIVVRETGFTDPFKLFTSYIYIFRIRSDAIW